MKLRDLGEFLTALQSACDTELDSFAQLGLTSEGKFTSWTPGDNEGRNLANMRLALAFRRDGEFFLLTNGQSDLWAKFQEGVPAVGANMTFRFGGHFVAGTYFLYGPHGVQEVSLTGGFCFVFAGDGKNEKLYASGDTDVLIWAATLTEQDELIAHDESNPHCACPDCEAAALDALDVKDGAEARKATEPLPVLTQADQAMLDGGVAIPGHPVPRAEDETQPPAAVPTEPLAEATGTPHPADCLCVICTAANGSLEP
jgi:hypothetical protein